MSWRCISILMFIGPCIIVIVEEWKTNLMSLAILFHFLCAQHVSDINISIIRNLRLSFWITTSVVLFSVRCVLEIWCGWFWVVFVLQYIISVLSKIVSKCAAAWSAAYRRAAALLMCVYCDGVAGADTGSGSHIIVEWEQVTLHSC